MIRHLEDNPKPLTAAKVADRCGRACDRSGAGSAPRLVTHGSPRGAGSGCRPAALPCQVRHIENSHAPAAQQQGNNAFVQYFPYRTRFWAINFSRQSTPVITWHHEAQHGTTTCFTRSQSAFIRSGATLADLLAAVAVDDLPARRRHDMASAVRTVARLLGGAPGELPASPRLLVNRLADVAPAAHGVSQPQWNNFRCLLRAALASSDRSAGPAPRGLSPGSQALWDHIALWRTRSGGPRFLRSAVPRARVLRRSTRRPSSASPEPPGQPAQDPAATLRGSRRAWASARRDVAAA